MTRRTLVNLSILPTFNNRFFFFFFFSPSNVFFHSEPWKTISIILNRKINKQYLILDRVKSHRSINSIQSSIENTLFNLWNKERVAKIKESKMYNDQIRDNPNETS